MSNLIRLRHPHGQHSVVPAAVGRGGLLECFRLSPDRKGVSKKDGSPLEKGVPEYLVEPLEYDIEALDLDSGAAQLVGFGSGVYLTIICRSFRGLTTVLVTAFFASSPPKTIYTPLSLHPPELVFQRPLTQAVDIWNLGCTVRRFAAAAHFQVADPVTALRARRRPYAFRGGVRQPGTHTTVRTGSRRCTTEWVRGALTNGVLDKEPDGMSPYGVVCTLH
jgi:serine/threonine protein kinase